MKYIDSFETSKFKTKGNKSLFKNIDTIIKNDLLQIDLLHEAIIYCDKIIQNIEQNDCENKDDLIDKYNSIRSFYDGNCRFLLLEADVLVPYKYLFQKQDDWEYRFFVRRIYTLIHETQNGVLSLPGDIMNIIESLVGDKFIHYKKALKELNKFINKTDACLKEVRNVCEAHKDKNINKQITAIESISIKDSLNLIQDFYNKMSNVNKNLFIILNELPRITYNLSCHLQPLQK